MTTVTTTNQEEQTNNNNNRRKSISKPPRPNRILFSFESYANNLIQNLKSSNIIIEQGLTETEFSILKSKFNLNFPPDLRLILQQGLPISPCFPNWRSSSYQQLKILVNLPITSILRRVKNNHFWHPSWGPQPKNNLVESAEIILKSGPQLVPIYRHCYIPCSPNVAGNPVFYIDHGGDVKLVSFDIVGFFRDSGILSRNEEVEEEKEELPVWAAKKARRIEIWSEVANGRGERRWRWWWEDNRCDELKGCMEGVLRRLREGGWKEEEIREILMNEDEEEKRVMKDTVEHMRVLLRAGWNREDVVELLGVDEGKSWLDLELELDRTATIGVNIDQQ